MPQETIGERIRIARTRAGLSQKQLARAVYVTRQTVYRWERDKSIPYAHDIKHIATCCGVSCDWLIIGNNVTT